VKNPVSLVTQMISTNVINAILDMNFLIVLIVLVDIIKDLIMYAINGKFILFNNIL